MFYRSVFALFGGACLCATQAYAGCSVFEHRDYRGAEWYLADNETLMMVEGESIGMTTNGHCPECEYTVEYEPSWNDSVSSFRVDGGCRLTLWEHINEGGAHFRSGRSYTYVGDDWNDEASEAQCVCTG